MKIFRTDEFALPLPDGHRFPVTKYALLRQRVEAAGIAPPADLIAAPAAGDEEITRAHTAEYVRRVNYRVK